MWQSNSNLIYELGYSPTSPNKFALRDNKLILLYKLVLDGILFLVDIKMWKTCASVTGIKKWFI